MTPDAENRTLSDKFMLRLPDGMRARIKAAAKAANRSMNAEIVAALEEKFPPPLVRQKALLDLLADATAANREHLVELANRVLVSDGIDARFVIDGDAIRLVEK